MNAKELFNKLYSKAEKKPSYNYKKLLPVLFCGLGFFLFLNFNFEQ